MQEEEITMKKKIISMLLAAAMVCTCFVGCGSKVDESSSDIDVSATDVSSSEPIDISNLKLIKDGTLTVGMEIGYPPFEDKAEDGTAIGYDVDMIYAIGDKLGLEINLIDTAFDLFFAGLGTNYDCIVSAVTITDERQEQALFSTPYIENYQAVAVKKGSDIKIESLQDLSGHSVMLQKGTTSQELLEDMIETGTVTNCTMAATEQILTCFTALDNGEYEIVLCDSTVAANYVTMSPDKYEIAYIDDQYPEQFGIAMGKEDTALQTAINEAMAQLKEEGFFEENNAKWFAE